MIKGRVLVQYSISIEPVRPILFCSECHEPPEKEESSNGESRAQQKASMIRSNPVLSYEHLPSDILSKQLLTLSVVSAKSVCNEAIISFFQGSTVHLRNVGGLGDSPKSILAIDLRKILLGSAEILQLRLLVLHTVLIQRSWS